MQYFASFDGCTIPPLKAHQVGLKQKLFWVFWNWLGHNYISSSEMCHAQLDLFF